MARAALERARRYGAVKWIFEDLRLAGCLGASLPPYVATVARRVKKGANAQSLIYSHFSPIDTKRATHSGRPSWC